MTERKLYNVSFDTDNVVTRFYPRVPRCPGPNEDRVTPRICLADTVERCIAAMGFMSRTVKAGKEFLVRSVRVADLSRSQLITPIQLFERGLVPDALFSTEYWYTDPIDFELHKYRITNCRWEYALNFTTVKKSEVAECVRKYTDKINESLYSSAEDVYIAAIHFLKVSKMYNAMDDLYEDVSNLYWAQGLLVSKLEVEEVLI